VGEHPSWKLTLSTLFLVSSDEDFEKVMWISLGHGYKMSGSGIVEVNLKCLSSVHYKLLH
jgi:hypothetical protein